MDDIKDPNQEQPMGGDMPQPGAAPEGGENPMPGMPAEGGNEGASEGEAPEAPGGDQNQPGQPA